MAIFPVEMTSSFFLSQQRDTPVIFYLLSSSGLEFNEHVKSKSKFERNMPIWKNSWNFEDWR